MNYKEYTICVDLTTMMLRLRLYKYDGWRTIEEATYAKKWGKKWA